MQYAHNKIQFLAVTICPQTKIPKDLFDYTEIYHLIQNATITKQNQILPQKSEQLYLYENCNKLYKKSDPFADQNTTKPLVKCVIMSRPVIN